ncbi:MAG: pyridoxal-phosphate dependent enzyme [Schleiferiaceae bacterium]|jgi:1-aminocyclopropane-1-carboxylate deaminase|nr:pyridoxal-phosphate dependent enzyme [Schleiferiaceae bacterium]
MFNLPSPLEKIEWSVALDHGIEVWMKRDDQIHHVISGNKWRKLKYSVKEVRDKKYDGLLTFGGAFSNHIAATAHAGRVHGISTIGIIRGEEADRANPTLTKALKDGMQLVPISREEYARKELEGFLEQLQAQYPGYLIVPEGGANRNGVLGCMEILTEVQLDFDVIACPLGTSTTFSGIVASAGATAEVLGFPALKGGGYLRAHVNNFLEELKSTPKQLSTFSPTQNWKLIEDYHFGGFAKMKEPLVRFMNAFWKETGIPLDPVYTAKMMFGLDEMIRKGHFKNGTKLLTLHTGGLQGIAGMNKKLKNKNYNIEYEDKI